MASRSYKALLLIPGCAGILYIVTHISSFLPPQSWTEDELILIRSLSLDNLSSVPADPSNQVADNLIAAEFGAQIFSDTRFSINGEIACSTCHQPELGFTDGLEKAQTLGQSKRHTPGIIGTSFSPWLYWDGRKDSQWAQALSPLEDPAEHGGNRLFYVHLIQDTQDLRSRYEEIFGPMDDFTDLNRFPANATDTEHSSNLQWNAAWNSMTKEDQLSINRVFSNIGKIIAAYERTLLPSPTPFDFYVSTLENDSSSTLNNDEIRGLRLFIGEARCIECHNGPLFTNNEFHNTGLISYPNELPDRGRINGLKEVLSDPFNCKGMFNDEENAKCNELHFVRSGEELIGAFRTPSLRNIHGTSPYMHKGQLHTLEEVLIHYNEAKDAMIGHNEAEPLNLNSRQLKQLEAFLNTLNSN